MRHLQTLAGNNLPEQLMRTLWLGRLPPQAQAILATRSEDRLEDIARQADQIIEITNRTTVAAAAAAPATLEEQIKALTRQVERLTTQAREQRSRSRDRSRNRKTKDRTSSQTRRHTGTDDGQCFYHYRFGEKAKKCRQPCSYKKENTEGSR